MLATGVWACLFLHAFTSATAADGGCHDAHDRARRRHRRTASTADSTQEGSAAGGTFLMFTDLHLDPYYGGEHAFRCSAANASRSGEFDCDSPYELVEATISGASHLFPNPDFVLVAGDNVRHDGHEMPDLFGSLGHIFDNVTDLLLDHFPFAIHAHSSPFDSPMHLVNSIGNNDVQPDYVLDTHAAAGGALNPTLEIFKDHWARVADDQQLADLGKGGYYGSTVTAGLLVLSVNTVIYSTHHCNSGPAFACENDGTAEPANAPLDPLGQFAWLTDQLLGARSTNTKVYILGHIPPVVASFDRKMFWKQPFADRYHDVVAEFADVIVAQLFGHTHSDEWRVENPSKDVAHPRPPLFISSAITPIFNNRPSFKRVTYNLTSKALLSYVMYTPTGWESGIDSLGQAQDWVWGEQMTTETTLQLPSLEASELYALSKRLETDDTVWTAYINTTFKAGVPDTAAACNASCRHSWKCLYGTVTKHDYDLCMAPAAPEPDGTDRAVVVAVAVATAAAVLLVLCVGMVAVRACRKRSGRYGVFIEDAGDQELLLLSDVTRDIDFVRPQARRPDATAYPLPAAVEPAEGSVVDALTFPEPNPAAFEAAAAVPAPVFADPGLNVVPDARHDGAGRTTSSASIRSAVYESE